MRVVNYPGRNRSRIALWAALVAGVCVIGAARADQFPADPVENLRKTLKNPLQVPEFEDPKLAQRVTTAKPEDLAKIQAEGLEQNLTRKIDAIQRIGDLRRALLLQEWPQDEMRGEGDELGAVMRKARIQLAERFQAALRRTLKEGDQAARLAAINMIADLGSSLLAPEQPAVQKGVTTQQLRRLRGPSGGLAPDLAEMVTRGRTRDDRQAAAYALGQIFPDPNIAVPALKTLLASSDVTERRAAAGGLVGIARVLAELSARGRTSTGGMEVKATDVTAAGTVLVPVVCHGLTDGDIQVRRLCSESIELSAAALNSQVPEPPPTEEFAELRANREAFAEARAQLMPVMNTLRDHAKSIGAAVNDSDSQVRLRARRALEEMGTAHLRFQRSMGGVDTNSPGGVGPGARNGMDASGMALVALVVQANTPRENPLLEGLLTALPDLARGVQDPIVQNRLAAVDAIEQLGPSAAPAQPALVQALNDRDRFVRWAAARTLGKVGPVHPAIEVPILARLLDDQDVDVDRAAAVALANYGPVAQPAVPALTRMLRADHWVLRIQAVQTLESIGTGAASAIPALAAALTDPDTRVRRFSAELLGKFGGRAREAVPALERALGDGNADVRRAVSDALLSIATNQ
jgi:HEAT repeat protein